MSDSPDREELQRARSWALKQLARRARTESEMHDRLRRRGFSCRVVRESMDFLRRTGALDDEKFAREYVAYIERQNPMGRRRIEQELQKRGVQRESARRIVAQITPEKEEELARLALERRGGGPSSDLAREDRMRELRRLYGYLGRRGFPGGLVRRLLDLDSLNYPD